MKQVMDGFFYSIKFRQNLKVSKSSHYDRTYPTFFIQGVTT